MSRTESSAADSGRRRRPPGPARGIPLFRLFGIQIRVDWSWLIIFFVMVFILREYFQLALRGEPDWVLWVLSAASVIALFACVLAHELGHSLVAMRHGVQMFDITLFVFGGMARLRGEPRTAGDELKIALAGPAVTVVLACVFWGAWAWLHGMLNVAVAEGLRYLAVINTALLVFNLIPGFPLDGGRVLRAMLWRSRRNLLSATRTAAAVGKGFGMLLVFAGLLWLVGEYSTRGGISISGLFYIFMGWFLSNAANQSVQHMQIRNVLEAFQVANAMEPGVVTVSPELALDRLISEGFYRHHFKTFPVARDGRLVGLVSLGDVQGVPPAQWSSTTVGQVARRPAPAMTIRPEDGLYEAFRRMGEEDVGRLVVTDPAGRIVGIISRRDIMHLLQVHAELTPRLPARPPRQAIPVAEPVEPDAEPIPAGPESAEPSEEHAADEPAEPAPALWRD